MLSIYSAKYWFTRKMILSTQNCSSITSSFLIFPFCPTNKQVLPTNVRAVGLGSCSTFARLGAMSTPFVAQVLIHVSFYLVVGVYAALILLCVIAALMLPIETKGKVLAVSFFWWNIHLFHYLRGVWLAKYPIIHFIQLLIHSFIDLFFHSFIHLLSHLRIHLFLLGFNGIEQWAKWPD